MMSVVLACSLSGLANADQIVAGVPQKEASSNGIYMIDDFGTKHWIPNMAVFKRMGWTLAEVNVVPDGALTNYKAGFPCIPHGEFFLFQGTKTVYRNDGETEAVVVGHITAEDFRAVGNPWGKVTTLPLIFRSMIFTRAD